jgi:hypothetical protein
MRYGIPVVLLITLLILTIPVNAASCPGCAKNSSGNGTAATIVVNYTGTLPPGSDALVTNIGTINAAILDFFIPSGLDGTPGANGANGTSATATAGSTTTLPAGSSATVTNVGTINDAIFDFGIPAGNDGTPGSNGAPGANGINGTSASIDVNMTFTGLPGTNATVVNVGNTTVALLDVTVPQGLTGDTGAAGATGGTGGQILYFRHAASTDPVNYEGLIPVPAGATEVDEVTTIKDSSGKTLVDSYVTDVGYPALIEYPAGLWRFRTFGYVNTAAGTTTFVFDVYNRTAGGTETLLFSATSDDVNALVPTEYLTSHVQTTAYPVALTDRIVVKVSVQTTHNANVDVHWVYEGTTHTSHIQTTLSAAPDTSLVFNVIAGETLYKGQAVYISGATGGNPVVMKADNTNTAKSRVVGLMDANTATGSNGIVRRAGALTNVDTRNTNGDLNPLGQTWAAGDLLFATTGGGLTNVRPTSGRSVKAAYTLAGSSAADSLMAYPMENPVWSTAASNEGIVLRLGDGMGATNISVRNYANTQVANMDSFGYLTAASIKVSAGDVRHTTDSSVLSLHGGDGMTSEMPAQIDVQSGGVGGNIIFTTPNAYAFGSEEVMRIIGLVPTPYISAVSHPISNVTDPSYAQDVATKNYVDTHSGADNDTMYYFINGSRMLTGNLNAGGNQINNFSTMQFATTGTIYGGVGTGWNSFVGGTGVANGGALAAYGATEATTPGAIKFYVTNATDATTLFMQALGDTNYPSLDMQNHDIISVGTSITKSQDDSYLMLKGGTDAYFPSMIVYGKNYADTAAAGDVVFYVGDAAKTGLLEAGRFNGNTNTPYLSMTSHAISNVTDPLYAQDVATKNYVDTHSSGSDTSQFYFLNGTRTNTGAMYFGAASGANNIGRNVSNDFLTIFGGSNTFPGAAISMSGTNRTTYGGRTYFYSTNAHGAQQEAMVITGNTDTPALTMVGAYLNMGKQAIDDVGTIQSADNTLISIHGGTSGGAAINLYGKSQPAQPGSMFFYVTDNTGSYIQTLALMGNLAAPYATASTPWYFNNNALYSVGTVVVSTITAMQRDVDNSYLNIYGGNGGGAAITINGKTSGYKPGEIDFWTTNAAGSTAAVAHFTGATNTPTLDMESHKITSVLDPTSAQDAATKNYVDAGGAWGTWSASYTWTGCTAGKSAPEGAGLASTTRYFKNGKVVHYTTNYYAPDSNGCAMVTMSMPITAPTTGVIYPSDGIEAYGAGGTTYKDPLPYVGNGEQYVRFLGSASGTDGSLIDYYINGDYEVA